MGAVRRMVDLPRRRGRCRVSQARILREQLRLGDAFTRGVDGVVRSGVGERRVRLASDQTSSGLGLGRSAQAVGLRFERRSAHRGVIPSRIARRRSRAHPTHELSSVISARAFARPVYAEQTNGHGDGTARAAATALRWTPRHDNDERTSVSSRSPRAWPSSKLVDVRRTTLHVGLDGSPADGEAEFVVPFRYAPIAASRHRGRSRRCCVRGCAGTSPSARRRELGSRIGAAALQRGPGRRRACRRGSRCGARATSRATCGCTARSSTRRSGSRPKWPCANEWPSSIATLRGCARVT